MSITLPDSFECLFDPQGSFGNPLRTFWQSFASPVLEKSGAIIVAPAGFLPRRPKPEEASWKSLRIREENFAVAEKNIDFSSRARKVLPKSTKGTTETSQGVEEHSKESESGVFARDSEVEREEL